MPDTIVTYIQTPVGTDAAAMDAEVMPFGEWCKLHGNDEPEIETAEDLQRWWDWHDDQADWRMCQRMGVGL